MTTPSSDTAKPMQAKAPIGRLHSTICDPVYVATNPAATSVVNGLELQPEGQRVIDPITAHPSHWFRNALNMPLGLCPIFGSHPKTPTKYQRHSRLGPITGLMHLGGQSLKRCKCREVEASITQRRPEMALKRADNVLC